MAQVHVKLDLSFAHRNLVGNLAVGDADVLLQPFEQAHARVVAGDDAFRACKLHQQGRQLGHQAIGPLRERLDGNIVPVSVDDQRRNEVAFAVNEPIRTRVDLEAFAKRDGLLQPQSPEPAVDRDIMARQDPQRDLGTVAVEGTSQEPAVRSSDSDDRAGFRAPIRDIAAVHPEVPVVNSLFPARRRR